MKKAEAGRKKDNSERTHSVHYSNRLLHTETVLDAMVGYSWAHLVSALSPEHLTQGVLPAEKQGWLGMCYCN